MRDRYGSQPSVELLRQWIDHKYWADLDDSTKLELVDLVRTQIMFIEYSSVIGTEFGWHLKRPCSSKFEI